MVALAFTFAIVTSLVFACLCKPFIDSLKDEAPEFYKSLGSPTVSMYVWHKQLFMPFSKHILFRSYRNILVNCPRSRAWASWLFVVHWLQMLAFALFVLTILR